MNRRKFVKTVPTAVLLATSGNSLIGSSVSGLKLTQKVLFAQTVGYPE